MTIERKTLMDALKWRYATKKFNPSKKISANDWAALEEALVLTPSSYGMQPWKFLVIENVELREKLKVASWNQSQITDASHLVVFAAKETLTEADVDKFLLATANSRGADVSSLDGYKKVMMGDFINGARSKIVPEWNIRQLYIALGNFMTSAAMLGIDTCPIEGLNPSAYDEILGLKGSGYRVLCACPAGYRADDDKYSTSPKVRYPLNEMIVRL